ncbi:MAG: right-handed parallel beta-helix repeat-containing protein [Planctomycetota bacterium]|jgi:hypothetical protein
MRKSSLLFACLLLAIPCSARTIIVDANGTGEYPTIQAAINDSNDSDIIEIQPGTYIGPGNRNIDFKGKAITVRSINPNNYNIVSMTLIDCQTKGRGFKFHSGEDLNSVVSGLTIKRGRTKNKGAGIYCSGSSPTIENCIIIKNTASAGLMMSGSGNSYGGGIFCSSNSNPTIKKCIINNNSTVGGFVIFSQQAGNVYGGGIYWGSDCNNPGIENCIINNNKALGGPGLHRSDGGDAYGGGIYCKAATIKNCLLSGNNALGGGSMRAMDGTGIGGGICGKVSISGSSITNNAILQNCTVVSNHAANAGGGYSAYGLTEETPPPSGPQFKSGMVNCIFFDNTSKKGAQIALLPPSPPPFPWPPEPPWPPGPPWSLDTVDEQAFPKLLIFSVNYSDIQGGRNGVYVGRYSQLKWGYGNINSDPCFVDTSSEDYHLLPGSLCIDAGDNNSVPADATDLDGDGNTTEPIPWDLDGKRRFLEHPNVPDTGNGTPPIIDMGAYEFDFRIEVPMKLTPQALNCDSEGQWVKAHFVLSEEFLLEDVDTNEPIVAELMGSEIQADHMNVFINKDGLVEIEAAFSRADFCSAVTVYRPVDVTVRGMFTAGYYFCGTDTIKIINKNLEYLATLASYWLNENCRKPDWCGGLDVDHSSSVDFVDFAIIAEN